MFDGEATPTLQMRFDVATAAIKGARTFQEDSIIASFPMGQTAGFAIVADGIGGHVAGHLASALVTTEMFAHMKMQESLLISGALDVPFALRTAATQANKKIADHVSKDDATSGMGSTLLAPVIRGDRLSWLSIGDSPLYLFRGGALRQLNKDHSMAPQIDMMVKMGSLTKDAGKDHPDRNTLLSVINGEEIAQVDCPATPILLKAGDILIAATDGLQTLSNDVIAKTVMDAKDLHSVDLANAFLEALKELAQPDQDNATFAVIKISADAPVADVMDLDAMPVLAQVEEASTPEPEVAAEPVKEERKAYYYRGQKYYKD